MRSPFTMRMNLYWWQLTWRERMLYRLWQLSGWLLWKQEW